jgi:Cytochrome b(C-terminal)/b6/petD
MAEAARERTLPVDDKVHTWPHLVRMEFLCALFILVALTLWALVVDAPLEEPANPTRTPNPSKAPWYFLGLQEMLVYFDPWHAGVVLPSLIIVGLMVIPYIDINPKGNGYYCFKERKWEILTFIFGFHILWVSMIIIGTFFRGPGWNLFWPWQKWDPHKVVALTNVDLPYLVGFRDYWWSAAFSLVMVGGYFVVAIGLFYLFVLRIKGKEFLERWGMVRFSIVAGLMALMFSLPVKMALRLLLNVKYVLVTPWINI